MSTLVFTYRYRRIQEGLEHKEVSCWTDASKAPEGSYIYHAGQWYQRMRDKSHGATVLNKLRASHEVPKEIRTLCLILT